MINLLVGGPGGGKSYEAVVFHVLAALGKGRKVITNLALFVEQFALLQPDYVDLIELRTETKAPKANTTGKPRNRAPFSQVEDYGDTWRHPKTGAGPLYVVDECHISLPKVGTPVPVEEWYSLHRHEFADVLLISQSYGKMNVAVKDLLQIVYRVRKNIAFGSSKSYTRKVQDGVRGAVVNTAVRRYEPKYFSLYRSHTRSAEGIEMGAQDIIPIWRHWTVYGIGVCALVFVVVVWRMGNPLSMFKTKAPVAPVAVQAAPPAVRVVHSSPALFAQTQAVEADRAAVAKAGWPYGALDLHIGGWLRSASRSILLVVFSQNGQRVFEQTGADLQEAGFLLTRLNDCLVRVQWHALSQIISCDAPRLGVGDALGGAGGHSGTSSGDKGGGAAGAAVAPPGSSSQGSEKIVLPISTPSAAGTS